MQMEDFYLNIINNLRDGVYTVDIERKITFWNKAAENITGYSASEMVNRHCQDSMLHHIDENGQPLCKISCPLFESLIDGEQRKARVFVRHKAGYRIPLFINVIPITQNEKIVGAIEIFTQDSSTVYEDKLVEHLSGIAMHDTLTGLPNRRYIESFLNYKFENYKHFGLPFAVLFADIDNFSRFNDNYGHDTGDRVLITIAQSIMKNVHSSDLIGRWGGEEFVGVYSITEPQDARRIAEQFRQVVEHTELLLENRLLDISVSVGITAVRNSDSIASIIDRADAYMYQSKKDGKNRVTSDM